MDLHKRAAAHGQTRAAGLCLAALDWHQDGGQTPREQYPRPGTPREDQPLGSAQNHYTLGAVPSIAVGLGAAVSAPRTSRMTSSMVAAEVRRRILREKHFRLVTSAATALATVLERTLREKGEKDSKNRY